MDRLRPLIALKWTLALRGYQRDRTRLLGLILFLVLAIPLALGGAAFCLLAYRHLPGRLPFELLHVVLAAIWVLWIVVPIFGFSLNETYDPTKLFVFPLSTAAIFFASALGAFLDLPIIVLLPLLVAILVGFAHSVAGFAIVLLALALFTLQTVAFSQVCLTALLGLLKSRRFEDIAIVLVPLASVGVCLAVQLLAQRMALAIDPSHPEQLENLRISESLLWLPSGMAGAAIEHGSSGRHASALAFLGVLALVSVATILLGSAVLRRVHLGEIDVGRYGRAQPRPSGAASGGRLGALWGAIPDPVRAMAAKELRHIWREPEMKAILITFLLPVVFLVVWLRLAPTDVPRDAALMVVALSLFGSMHLAMNAFGHDRQGLEVLFGFPTRRRDILLGKNLAAGVFMATATGIVLALAVLFGGAAPSAFALAPFAAGALLIVLAAGNFSSIYFPTRIPRRGENPYTQSVAKGCVTGFFRALALQASLIAGVPVLAGFLGPWVAGERAWLLATAPLALVYAFIVYRASLGLAERSLLEQEDRILAVCAARED